jgi:hypothetical protein
MVVGSTVTFSGLLLRATSTTGWAGGAASSVRGAGALVGSVAGGKAEGAADGNSIGFTRANPTSGEGARGFGRVGGILQAAMRPTATALASVFEIEPNFTGPRNFAARG